MQIYDAFLKAADFIEQNPKRLDMSVTGKPDGGGQVKGCILGWVGAFAGKNFSHADDILQFTPHSSFGEFISTLHGFVPQLCGDDKFVPLAMRVYAETYLKDFVAPPRPRIQRWDSPIPPSVMKIFDTAIFNKEFEKVAA